MRSITTDYSRNPQQKVSFFLHIFVSLIVSSRPKDCKWRTKPTRCCSLNKLRQLKTTENVRKKGKIQGDVRKFLDRFKSYSGSQISPQSLNEIYICRLQPKSATNGEFCSYIFVFDYQLESAHVAL